MINKIKNFITLNKSSSKSKQTEGDFLVTRVIPKKEFLFGKVLSFSFDNHSVQMAASFHYGRSFRIIDVHKEYFIPDPKTSQTIEDFYEQSIKLFIDQYNSRFAKIFVTLTGESTLYRTFLLPYLKHKELATAVQFEVKKVIPFPIEESIYDFRVIQQIEDLESSRVKVSLHATTKENIHKLLTPFQKHNIKVDKILHSHDTIGQLLGLLKDFDVNQNYILINIGKKITEVSFYHGRTLEFSRSNILSTDMLGNSSDTTKLEYFAESIANEIQNSLDFYSGQLSSTSNNNILLYGDFAYSDEFINSLNTKLEINLVRFPVDKLKITYSKEDAVESFPVCLPVFATSVNYSKLPDLLPTPLKLERTAHRINNYLKTAAAICVVTLSSSWMYMNSTIHTLKKNNNSLDSQISIFKESDAYHTYKIMKKEIAYDKSYINLAKEAPSYMYLNLKELSRITPDNIKLFHLDFNPKNEDKNYFIQGTVTSNDIPPEIALAEYIENLSSSPFYEDIQIVRHVKKKNKANFEIEFLIKMKGIV